MYRYLTVSNETVIDKHQVTKEDNLSLELSNVRGIPSAQIDTS